MYCTNCNKEYPENEKNCPICSEKLIKVDDTIKKKTKYLKKLKVSSVFLMLVLIYLILEPTIRCTIRTTTGLQWKPIIYLYPKEETKVTITTSHPENFTITYPKYQDGWTVTAKPDGTLIDKNGREYYALYWEGKNNKKNPRKEDGFVIQGKDTSKFLEDKLKILGLSDREANEFIIYWLPKLENNKWNYIRFQTLAEINKTMELKITPQPDTLIRVMMEFEPLDKKIEVQEQELNHIERKGFTVVEWGGTNIN